MGLYTPGKQWTRLVANQDPGTEATARPIDDQIIIVVADTQTGEIRGCGDLTGFCIGLNPWKRPLPASQVAPIGLTEHMPDTANAADNDAAAAESDASAAMASANAAADSDQGRRPR